jgi:BirA family transcriptional regulator, biotin operon repressor / biotin---[acetyl-CoA-carboxylase] ligase
LAHQPIIIGEYSVFLEETNSTNDALKILYSQEALPDGAVLYTNFQTKGRGQQNNVWESEPGENLLLSALLQPQFLLADEQIWVNVMVSLALRDTAEELSKTPAFIKWPNDIYVQNKKVAGVLIENVLQGHRMRFSIVGIGLNLNQQQFKAPNAQSLSVISGAWIDPKPARLKLLEKLTHYYALLKGKQHNLLWDMYHQYLYGKGKLALFQQNGISFEAEIMGIDKKGRLHLLVQDEIKSFAHKELEFIKLLE